MNKLTKIIISFLSLLLISFFILSNNFINKVAADEVIEASITTNHAPVSIVNYSNEVTESSDTYNYNTQLAETNTTQTGNTTINPTETQAPTANLTTNKILETKPTTLELIHITKKIFIGDSRTVQMKSAVNSSDIWSCESSMGLDWMKSTGVPNIESQITTGTAVIILMGVNDLFNVDNYITYINQKTTEWRNKGARVYFVSVNPINENTYNGFKNTQIEIFNNKMASNLVNVKYIDTYDYLLKNNCNYTSDGLHYQNNTSKVIYDFITKQLN